MTDAPLSGLFADRYLIERVIGRGASATVYLAHDNKQDRQIALKVLDHELANAIGAKRFLQEIHITARLQHPHILPIHDSGEWRELLYYVLPYVAGESLRARLDREKQLPIEECVRFTCDVAAALSHAHSTGVIHRDVKPENILLSDGHALIADFGIARSIDVVTGERLTSSGLIVGTSQYMSPEQASGEREIDSRSDIYSLACVLYEMLAGVEPFVGPNVQAIIAQRFTHAPRAVSTFRPTVPKNLEEALDTALAISPADRFQTMKEFAAALPSLESGSGDRRRRGRQLRNLLRTRKGKSILGAAVLSVILVIIAMIPGVGVFNSWPSRSVKLDSSLHVVLPLLDERGAVSASGRQSATLVYRAMHQWEGLNVVPDLQIGDALSKSGNPTVLSEALKRAKEVGAGRLIWGTVGASSGILQLYDVNTGMRVREVEYSPQKSAPESTLVKLFRDPTWPRDADGALGRTKSFPAWQAYGRAHAQLNKWGIEKAQIEFDRAAQIDNGFVPARLWSAQVRSWKADAPNADTVAWVRDAAFAASGSAVLTAEDALLARALSAMAVKDFAAACAQYRTMVALDSMDAIAWHGMGKCEMLDEVVVRSRASPSGWAFRSSYANAAESFTRALQLDPRAHAIITFDNMQKLLATSPTKIRGGRDPASGTRVFAFPSISNDTLAYLPYPMRAFASLTVAGKHDALDRNARSLLEFTSSWTESDPRNPLAWEAHSTVLETLGSIGKSLPAESSVSGAVARALSLSSDAESRVRLATKEVRVRIKRGEFAEASRLADSVLSNTPETGTRYLLVLAAFTGRIEPMIRLSQLHKEWIPIVANQYVLMPDLVATAAELFARAAAGECGATIDRLQQVFDNQLDSYVSADKRAAVRQVLMARTYSLLTPCTNGTSAAKITTPENQLYRLQQAYAEKNRPRLRALIDSMTAMRAESRPGDRSADFTYQEAWILSAAGDTAAAARKLDLALSALPSMSAMTLTQPAAAAAIGRMMVLRADLASKTGDAATARRWGKAASELWRYASKPLAPTVARMRALSTSQ